MAEKNNGRGTTKLKTADQHNIARRAAKAKQRRNRHHGQADNAFSARLEATSRPEQDMRDQTQADEARRIIARRNLRPGSLAYRLAMDIIDAFPYVQRDGKKSKTSMAVSAACRRLSAADKQRQKAVRLGINTARAALFDAGNWMHSNGLVHRTESSR